MTRENGQYVQPGGTFRQSESIYDARKDRESYIAALQGTDALKALADKVDLNDPTTIITFGSESARAVSEATGDILKNGIGSEARDPGAVLRKLSVMMERFDLREMEKRPGLFECLFGSKKKREDEMLEKYTAMGDEVDGIYVLLKQYEDSISRTADQLYALLNANIESYHDMIRHVCAGEQILKESRERMAQGHTVENGTGSIQSGPERKTLEQNLALLETRVSNLKIAESVSVQTISMLSMLLLSNINMMNNINAAFLITLPAFRQALSQVILMKRQSIQAEAMQALKKRTGELLAQNAVHTGRYTGITKNSPALPDEMTRVLQDTFTTIKNGITEAGKLQTEAAKKRREEEAQLQKLHADFEKRFGTM